MSASSGWVHGSAVDKATRKLRFLSVSSMSTADPGEGGCLRKWFYQYILGHKQPSSKSQERGVEGHAQIANYLLGGPKAFGTMAMSGLHFVPAPGKDLLVEWDVLHRPGQQNLPITAENSPKLLEQATLRANGVPVLGFIDLAHARGVNKGADNVTDMIDPPGTAEVCDWKFMTGDRYLKKPSDLIKTIQLVGYGKWIFQVRPETTLVRLSLGYFVENGRSRKVTALARREEIDRAWEHADGVARSIAHAACETNADLIDANLDACGSYGGCLHRKEGRCTAGMDKSLAAIMGATSAKNLLPVSENKGLIPVPSLLKTIQKKTVDSAVASTPAPDASAVAQAQARLQMEEKTAKLKAMVPEGFQAACSKVQSFQRGFPKLAGAAAQAYAAMGGQEVAPDYVFLGTGTIDYVELTDPAQMTELAQDLAADTDAPVSPIPPDAPASNPALASSTALAAAEAASTMQAATTLIENAAHTAKVDAATVAKVAQLPAPPDPMTAEPAATPAPAAGKKRAPKAKAPSTDGILLFVDCHPNIEHQDLGPWVREICDRLAKEADAADILCAPDASSLGYAKWEGALTAMVRSPELTPLAAGTYYLDTRDSRTNRIAAVALKERCDLWVR